MKIDEIKELPKQIRDRLSEWFIQNDLTPELWKPQAKAIEKGILDPKTTRFVLGLATAAGKTLIGELKALKTIFDSKMGSTGNKVLYLVPLKALATEKMRDFTERWGEDSYSKKTNKPDANKMGVWKYAINIYYLKSLSSRGYIKKYEYEREKEMFRKGNIFIATYEKADVYIRNRSNLYDDVKLVIIDEGHLIGSESRGPIVEMIISRLKLFYPNITILFLSATIGNIEEVANWLEYFPGKPQKRGKFLGKILNDTTGELEIWRPVPLYKGVFVYTPKAPEEKKTVNTAYYLYENKIMGQDIKKVSNNSISDLVIDALKNRNNPEQVLVFSSTRKSAEVVARKVSKIIRKYHLLKPHESKILEIIAKYFFIDKGYAKTRVEYNPDSKSKDDLYNLFINGAAFHHAGLCLTKDALIQLANGSIYSIKELANSKKKSYQVISLDTKSMKLKPKEVKKVWKIPAPKELIKVITKSNNEIIVTYNHPLLTINNGETFWKKAGELREGEFIAVVNKINTYPESNPPFLKFIPDNSRIYDIHETVKQLTNNKINNISSKLNISKDLIYSYRNNKNISYKLLKDLVKLNKVTESELNKIVKKVSWKGEEKRFICIPKHVSPDFLRLVGLVAGDGNINRSGRVSFSGTNKKLTLDFKRIVQNEFEINCKEYVKNEELCNPIYSVYINSRFLAEILVNSFGLRYGKKSHIIDIPQSILKLPDKHISSYIQGLFDCDGSVSYRTDGGQVIEFYSTSKILCKKLQLLLLRFGILSSIRSRKNKETTIRGILVKSNYLVYRISIYGKDNIILFNRYIGFKHPKKREELKKIIEKSPKPSYQRFVIPNLGSNLREIREELIISFTKLDNLFPQETAYRYENNQNPITRKNLKKLLRIYKKEAVKQDNQQVIKKVRELRKYTKSDTLWERIKRIEKIPSEDKWLYDLTIEGTKSFIADGFIAHNSDDLRQLIELTYTGKILYDIYNQPKIWEKLKLNRYITKEEEIKKFTLLRFIGATPTLASGVNLPSGLVIIPNPTRYNSMWGGIVHLSVSEIYQMFGRAGRPGTERGRALLIHNTLKGGNIEGKEIEGTDLWQRYILGEVDPLLSKITFIKDPKILHYYSNKIQFPSQIIDVIEPRDLDLAVFDTSSLIKQILASIYMQKEAGVSPQELKDILENTFFWYLNIRYIQKISKELDKITLTNTPFRNRVIEIINELSKDLNEYDIRKPLMKDFYAEIKGLYPSDPNRLLYLIRYIVVCKQLNSILKINANKALWFLHHLNVVDEIGNPIYNSVMIKLTKKNDIIERINITDFGEEVARLYLDPRFAGYIYMGSERFNTTSPDDLRFLHLLSMDESVHINTYIKDREIEIYKREAGPGMMYIDPPYPDIEYSEYEKYFKAYKTAKILQLWIEEFPTQFIIDAYNMYDSDLSRKFLGAYRLASILPRLKLTNTHYRYCMDMNMRIRYGIKHELIPLCRLRDIGRVRARNLFTSGFYTPLFLYFSFIKISDTIIKQGKKEISQTKLVNVIDIKKDKKDMRNNKDLIGDKYKEKYPLGVNIYITTETMIRKYGKAPTRGTIVKHIYKKSYSSLSEERQIEFSTILKKLIELNYIREIRVPILDPKDYKWKSVTRYVPHNDALVINSILKPGIALRIYNNILNDSRIIEIINTVSQTIIDIIKYLQSRKEIVNEENIRTRFREINNYYKKVDNKNTILDVEIDFITNRLYRIFKETNKIPEPPIRMPPIIETEISDIDKEILNYINEYIQEAISEGIINREDIYPDIDDIIDMYIEDYEVTKSEAERVIKESLRRLSGEYIIESIEMEGKYIPIYLSI